MTDVTHSQSQINDRDPTAAEQLLPVLYDELRELAAARLAQEQPGQTLQPTALVHEAYLRLVDDNRIRHWNGRGHFFGAAAEAMRRILVERARHKRSARAGGTRKRVELASVEPEVCESQLDVLALDDALQQLSRQDSRACDVVKLRFFAGLTVAQAADALGVSVATAENDWAYAKSWLKLQLGANPPAK